MKDYILIDAIGYKQHTHHQHTKMTIETQPAPQSYNHTIEIIIIHHIHGRCIEKYTRLTVHTCTRTRTHRHPYILTTVKPQHTAAVFSNPIARKSKQLFIAPISYFAAAFFHHSLVSFAFNALP